MKPLDGTVVLDLTRLLPGGLMTQTLASFGAEVWKIEEPERGDHARHMPPRINGNGAYFLLTNCGKKSIALNLKRPEGRDLLLRMVQKADVLIESFRPGVMARLGLDYASLSPLNRRLIYVAMTGYGRDGSYAQRAGHDINYAALTGLLCAANAKPSPIGIQVADVSGAQQAVIGVLLALLARERTGLGQEVHISILASIFPFLTIPLAEYAATGKPEGLGLLAGKYACYNLYETAEGGFLALGALEPKFWASFCAAIGSEAHVPVQFTEDKQPELIAELQAKFRKHTLEQWLARLEHIDTCIAPVNDLPTMIADPEMNMRSWMDFVMSQVQACQPMGSPVLTSTPGELAGVPPLLGEHTKAILKEIGVADSEIENLSRQNVIRSADS